MKELTLNGRTYLTTKRAAEITGYTTDYVGQLARQGKIDAQLVGRNWYISEESIKKHKFGEAEVRLKEEEDTPAPQLEVLVSSASDVLDVEDELEREETHEVSDEPKENEEESSLNEMQNAWQDWYKAQRSVPEEAEEVFLSKEDMEPETEAEEVAVPITKMESPNITRVQPAQVKQEVIEKVEEERIPQPSPIQEAQLPVKRGWSGTGLVAAGAMTVLLVGVVVLSTGYVLTKGTDTPIAAAFQSVEDYLLGVQRID